MTDDPFGLHQIGQIRIQVTDVDRAAAFYRDQLGMRFLESAIYYRVDDIGQAVATMEGLGVTFDDRPHVVHRDPAYDLWMAFFRDPDGNILALMSEVPTG